MEHAGVRFLEPGEDGIAVVNPGDAERCGQDFAKLVDAIGLASSRAQGLSHIITTFSSFVASDDELYILVSDDGRSALGFLRVGPKHLFLWDRAGAQHEYQIMCLLDFFTYPSEQRKGYGRRMIDRMLADKGLDMQQVPIDRPSSLCLAFMKRHFGLKDYLPQSNNFVVFDQFWSSERPPEARASPLHGPSRTPVRPRPSGPAFSPHAQTPGRKRTGLNPITWQPYDD